MNLACAPAEEPVCDEWTASKPVATDATTANWSLKVNEAQAQAAMVEQDEHAWLSRLPGQLSPPLSPRSLE